jgi:DNA-binding response OmpR family regulator
VATEISAEDGVGVLSAVKDASPGLPVLVVSGSTTRPELTKELNRADLIRAKPVLPAELAADVETLLRLRKDAFWGALAVLKELRRLKPEIAEKLGAWNRLQLRLLEIRITRDLERANPSIGSKLVKIGNIAAQLGKIGMKVVSIANGVGGA